VAEKITNVVFVAVLSDLSILGSVKLEWGAPDNTELRKALNMYKGKYATLEWNLKYVDEVRDLISDEEYEALKAIARPSKHQERFIEVLSLE